MDILEKIIKDALLEDMPTGDITTDNLIPDGHKSNAKFIAKEEGIIAGIEVVKKVFELIGGEFNLEFFVKDGDKVVPKDLIATITGDTKTILKGERVALNLMQRMSGIATTTRKFVDELELDCQILDTRKTTPNLRYIEKMAVKIGGAKNHRYCLSDQVLIKDNHIDAVGSITKAVELVSKKVNCLIEVEVETYEQFLEALNTDCDIIMLDNMDNELMSKCVKANNSKKKLEASGNMTVERIKSVSMTGVDYISVGGLTHSPKALDISLKFH